MSTVEDTPTDVPQYQKKDFMSDQTIRWCPGCGDYSILSQVQTVFATLGIPKHKFAVISGIGCSSRFPYYMSTYGFHTIHGRAPSFATGLKLVNPELSVWLVTGDGDGLSIGGNHLIHVIRRNVDIQLLLFNNRIYGLTKGQYSPTSEEGKRTKSTPMGSVDHPFTPAAVALGADASFVARTVDIFVKEQRQVLTDAHSHRGCSFVEIWQNCNIFNDGAFADFTDRKTRDEKVLFVEHGQPLRYGTAEAPKGLVLNNRLQLEAIDLDSPEAEARVLVHDETNLLLGTLLARLQGSADLPVAMGVLYRVQRPVYEAGVQAQLDHAAAKPHAGDLARAIAGPSTWTVE
ncbi:MAG: 2-oxoacid:ferredoxin oxidoreductase subunit beta [Alphaproteobacteria bacterium]|nr:2-oxoacid:ferredoxin oxidoreductase subunit beta [Alphaproteobacteria bacterium]